MLKLRAMRIGPRVGLGFGTAISALLVALAQKDAIDSLQMLVSPNEAQQKTLAQSLVQRDAVIGQSLEQLQGSLVDEDDLARVAQLRKQHGTYRAGVKRISGMVLSGNQTEAAFAAATRSPA